MNKQIGDAQGEHMSELSFFNEYMFQHEKLRIWAETFEQVNKIKTN